VSPATIPNTNRTRKPLPARAATARILVADDEPVIRDILKKVLGRAGYEVKTARSIGRARKILSAGAADLLFLDLVIPGMRGPSTLLKLKRRYPALKIVVVTGQALGDEALAKVRALTDGWIEKPFPVAAVLHAAERALAR
jgi:two-component system phosphate regulon response regulator PhoB